VDPRARRATQEGETVIQRLNAAVLVLALAAAVGCGGGKGTADRSAASSADSAKAAQTDTTANPEANYISVNDPAATYTRADITMLGSYNKLDLDSIAPPVMNRVIHRMRTEKCTCGCPDTIDECLIKDPQCTTAITLANQIIREEQIKGS
jgi:hypothetical protein